MGNVLRIPHSSKYELQEAKWKQLCAQPSFLQSRDAPIWTGLGSILCFVFCLFCFDLVRFRILWRVLRSRATLNILLPLLLHNKTPQRLVVKNTILSFLCWFCNMGRGGLTGNNSALVYHLVETASSSSLAWAHRLGGQGSADGCRKPRESC